jgi:hypothetical protein
MARHKSLLTLFLLLTVLPAVRLDAQAAAPIVLTSDTIEGEAGTGEDIYFSLTAGPGEVTAIGEATFLADATDALLAVEFIDGDAASLAKALAGEVAGRGRDRAEEALRRGIVEMLPGAAAAPVTRRKRIKVTLQEEQTLLLRLRAGTGLSRFRVRLEGPITYPEPASPEVSDEALDAAAADDVAIEEVAIDEVAIDAPLDIEAESGAETVEVPIADDSTGDAPETAVTEARPPIRIPGKKVPVVKVPGRTAPPLASGAKTSRPAPIKVPSASIVRLPGKATPAATAGKAVPKPAPAKPALKVPSIKKNATKGGAQ